MHAEPAIREMKKRQPADRSWAEDVPDEAFPVEYLRRFPRADVIPTRADYLQSTADKVEKIMFPVELEADEPQPTGHVSESEAGHRMIAAEAAGKAICDVCFETFDNPHARRVHKGMAHKAK